VRLLQGARQHPRRSVHRTRPARGLWIAPCAGRLDSRNIARSPVESRHPRENTLAARSFRE